MCNMWSCVFPFCNVQNYHGNLGFLSWNIIEKSLKFFEARVVCGNPGSGMTSLHMSQYFPVSQYFPEYYQHCLIRHLQISLCEMIRHVLFQCLVQGEDTFSQYFPLFPEYSQDITIRHTGNVSIGNGQKLIVMSFSKWPPGGHIRFFGFRTTISWALIINSNLQQPHYWCWFL